MGGLIWAVTMINGLEESAMEIRKTPALPCMSSAQLEQDAAAGSASVPAQEEGGGSPSPLPRSLYTIRKQIDKFSDTKRGASLMSWRADARVVGGGGVWVDDLCQLRGST